MIHGNPLARNVPRRHGRRLESPALDVLGKLAVILAAALLLAGLVRLAAGPWNAPPAPAAAPGLELVLSGAVNTVLALPHEALEGGTCTPHGLEVQVPASAPAPYALALAFGGDPTAPAAAPVHYQLGPGVPAFTLQVAAPAGGGAARPATFLATEGSIGVREGTRRFSAFLVDDLGQRVYASGRLTCLPQ